MQENEVVCPGRPVSRFLTAYTDPVKSTPTLCSVGNSSPATVYEPWRFGSDYGERRVLFVPEVFQHPAKMHLGLLRKIVETYTDVGDTILDPMAGTGSLLIGAYLWRNVVLRDLQPEYVAMIESSAEIIRARAGMLCGNIDAGTDDARTAVYPHFDHIIFSPPYGFETGSSMSAERRHEMLAGKYGERWQRKLGLQSVAYITGFAYAGNNQNTGNKTGKNYWRDMRQVYANLSEQLRHGHFMIAVIKNHYRRGMLKDIVGQTVVECAQFGLQLTELRGRKLDVLSLWQRRRREQGIPVVEVEDVLVFEKVSR